MVTALLELPMELSRALCAWLHELPLYLVPIILIIAIVSGLLVVSASASQFAFRQPLTLCKALYTSASRCAEASRRATHRKDIHY
jgi:hypothetical protein